MHRTQDVAVVEATGWGVVPHSDRAFLAVAGDGVPVGALHVTGRTVVCLHRCPTVDVADVDGALLTAAGLEVTSGQQHRAASEPDGPGVLLLGQLARVWSRAAAR